MTEKNKPMWEEVVSYLYKLKVEGGYLYQNSRGVDEVSMCFVPDVDLTRYQAHLRDAYKQGYVDGQLDAKHGRTELGFGEPANV